MGKGNLVRFDVDQNEAANTAPDVQAKHLALCRHAKSSWADPDLADRDRPLNARGRRAAILVGRYLRDNHVRPELVLCSPATRARQTLELLQLAPTTEVLIDDQLYGAAPSELLTRLQDIPARINSAMLIGHNPAVEQLARLVLNDPAALPEKYPTGAIADLRLPIDRWHDLVPGAGTLHAFLTPRSLE
jgi:phosphohistidine phosphatase